MDSRDFRRTNEDGSPDVGPKITVCYTNWRGEAANRTISPVGFWFGKTEYHPELSWLLHCYDWEKRDWRDYALSDCNFTNSPANELTRLRAELAETQKANLTLKAACNQARLAFAGYVSVQSAINMLDAEPAPLADARAALDRVRAEAVQSLAASADAIAAAIRKGTK